MVADHIGLYYNSVVQSVLMLLILKMTTDQKLSISIVGIKLSAYIDSLKASNLSL